MSALTSTAVPVDASQAGVVRARGRRRAWIATAAGAGLVGLVVARVGGAAFVDGAREVDRTSLAVALVVGLVTSAACALRWRTVSAGLGAPLPFGTALSSVYRAQLVNVSVPGGVVGDVHRAALHRQGGATARAVGWERLGGLAVLLAGAAAVLLLHPVGVAGPLLLAGLVAGAVAVVLVARAVRAARGPRWAGVVRDDLARLGSARLVLVVVACSVVVVAGHAVTFVVAARAAGAAVGWGLLLPVAVVVLVAASVPTHVGGWGPREGAAAWAFAASGLDPALGVRASVVYAVVTTVALLPGLVPLLLGARAPRPPEVP